MRSVGIPARVVGIADWNNGEPTDPPNQIWNNHNWVEFWDG